MIERMPEVRTLSPADKLALITELWDDLASKPEDIPITAEQIAEVDRRPEEYRKNPDATVATEERRVSPIDGSAQFQERS
jgi:putative addiction module component (TIGR02574 family)